jgi:hypothetical protein
LKYRFLDSTQVAVWACRKGEYATVGLLELSKYRFMNLGQATFWTVQEAENYFARSIDTEEHRYLELTGVALTAI